MKLAEFVAQAALEPDFDPEEYLSALDQIDFLRPRAPRPSDAAADER